MLGGAGVSRMSARPASESGLQMRAPAAVGGAVRHVPRMRLGDDWAASGERGSSVAAWDAEGEREIACSVDRNGS